MAATWTRRAISARLAWGGGDPAPAPTRAPTSPSPVTTPVALPPAEPTPTPGMTPPGPAPAPSPRPFFGGAGDPPAPRASSARDGPSASYFCSCWRRRHHVFTRGRTS